ncbi:Uncharacterized protein dnm_086310 [Desulfonema magnum]|uniref:Uncharacterized protein n=1 Tax=Desulfonema magnum TaxID=45655 RepID=A0A975GTW3_9BACT|nr:Uncharacterized protein dnm_086310 [Desulfonema magnum]
MGLQPRPKPSYAVITKCYAYYKIFSDYNGFRGWHNILKLLNGKTENLPVPGF